MKNIICAFAAVATLTSVFAAEIQKPAENQWKDARVAVFGDSLTDPNQTKYQKVYWQFITEWTGWKAEVFGLGGNSWGDLSDQVDRAEKSMGDNVDAVTILLGTNDYAGATPLGQWYDVIDDSTNWWGKTVMMKRRVLSRDPKTLRGTINLSLGRIRNRWPKARVILMTPTHREYFKYSDTNVQPGEEWPNTRGLYVEDYVKCVREAADIWGCALIDLYRDSGLLPRLEAHHRDEFRSFENDGLHPNTEGHLRMAKTIYYSLRSISR